jgi:hypothetical protein
MIEPALALEEQVKEAEQREADQGSRTGLENLNRTISGVSA